MPEVHVIFEWAVILHSGLVRVEVGSYFPALPYSVLTCPSVSFPGAGREGSSRAGPAQVRNVGVALRGANSSRYLAGRGLKTGDRHDIEHDFTCDIQRCHCIDLER